MPKGEKSAFNNQNEDDFSFEDIFDLSEAEKTKSPEEKEKEKKDQLAKEVAFHLYDELHDAEQGKDIADNLKDLIPGGEGIIKNLKALKKVDLMPVLQKYFKVREEEGPEASKLYLFFDVKNPDIESLIIRVESVSNFLNKDIIRDLIERDELEQKFKKIDDFIKKTKIQHDESTGEEIALPFGRVYLSYANTFDELMDEDNIRYLRGQKLSSSISEKVIAERLENIKDKLAQIIDWELESLDKREFEYGQMSENKREQLKKTLKDFKHFDVAEIFNIKNLAFIGQIIENRIRSFDQLEAEYEKLNREISKYFPTAF